MADIIVWPGNHARPSATSRAAKRVSKSALRPNVLAFSVAKIADHHSEGMLSRCHHFETADARAPRSDAMASREDQSSIRARNDAKSVMTESVRQTVLKIKDNTSLDLGISLGHNVLVMKAPDSAKVSKDHFTARVAYARHKAGYTQATMAEALGFGPVDDPKGQGKYHKYERRSWMPHTLIPQFCSLCEIPVAWLFSGPVVARPVEKRGRKPKPAPTKPPKQRRRAS